MIVSKVISNNFKIYLVFHVQSGSFPMTRVLEGLECELASTEAARFEIGIWSRVTKLGPGSQHPDSEVVFPTIIIWKLG